MKKIFLIGDPSIDWLIYHQPNQTPTASYKLVKNLDNNPQASIQKLPGGVLLLKRFLKHLLKETDELITYPDIEVDEILKQVPIHTIGHIKNCDPKHPDVLHVDQFLGYSINPGITKDNQLYISGNASDADLIIIDDAGNGMRNDENNWIRELNENKLLHIIHKINWPLNPNQLTGKLSENHNKKIIAILNADDIREHGLKISRQLSWDKTIEDFLTAFPSAYEMEDLRNYGTIIVRFNLEATLIIFNDLNTEEKKDAGKNPEHYFFYYPSKYEGETMDEAKGNMQGITHAFVAAFANRLLHPPVRSEDNSAKKQNEKTEERFRILSAIIPAMQAAGNCLVCGYKTDTQSVKTDYCVEEIFDQKKSENEIKFAGITGYMQVNEPRSLLKHLTLNSKNLTETVSAEYVKKGKSFFLEKIPVFEIGNFKTYDREEIESYRSLSKLINEYLLYDAAKPLSIAVFGPPGSGKSFGVKQMVQSKRMREK